MPRLVFHISAHGYGHAARASQVINALPAEFEIEIASAVPEHFFHRALERPFSYRRSELDVGCLMAGPFRVDVRATAEALARLMDHRDELVATEAERLVEGGARIVAADSGFLPLAAARLAGLPAVLIASFTWVEIYAGYIDEAPLLAELLPGIRAEYEHLTRHLKPPLAMDFDFGARSTDIGLIAQVGRSIRDRLAAELSLAPDEKLGLIYLGVYGRGELTAGACRRLERLDGWRFVGFEDDFPAANYHRLDPAGYLHQDVIASADAVLGKPGYSLLAACLACATPLIHPPRPNWPETPVLERAAAEWGGGIKISAEDFARLRLDDALARAAAMELTPLPAPGGREAAAWIVKEIEDRAG